MCVLPSGDVHVVLWISLCGNRTNDQVILLAQVAESVAIVIDVTTPIAPRDFFAVFIVVPNTSIEISNHTQHIMWWYLLNDLL